MVQFLSIIFFFFGFLQFLLGFSKVPIFFFCVILYVVLLCCYSCSASQKSATQVEELNVCHVLSGCRDSDWQKHNDITHTSQMKLCHFTVEACCCCYHHCCHHHRSCCCCSYIIVVVVIGRLLRLISTMAQKLKCQ